MIRQRLVDSISLDTFNRIVNFRLTANLDYLSVFTDNQRNQYFEDFLRLNPEGEVFADVGGFDGRTTLDFISKSPGFKEAHIFEPDPENFTTIKNVFRDELRVQVHNIGLGDSKGVARFSSSGSTSAITREGDFEVRIEKLDNLFLDELTFLKMDVEGAESGALEGARETIARCKPRLAVAVYHNPDDMWQIPIKILSMHKDYDLYLRHYTEGVTETVMFFIPKQ
jgi:FkbM family methyltransferase